MSATLTVRDRTAGSTTTREFSLDFLTEHITVRELIRSRVYQEVTDYNHRQPEYYRGLDQPTDAEQTLNGYRLRKGRTIDWRKQFDKALEAFDANRVLILIDHRQAESLDDELEIRADTKVTFLRLMPLVGG
jgi:hypothetical protein